MTYPRYLDPDEYDPADRYDEPWPEPCRLEAGCRLDAGHGKPCDPIDHEHPDNDET